jgi:glycosyltransferase involved in cell wall biosynthesis
LQGQGPLADVVAVTPSRWSAEGFYKAGFRTDQVLVVPHGVDCALFRPMPELRAHVRGKMGIAEDDFVFLSIGTMTSNKGMDLLLQAFAEVSRKFPQARLVLKGVNSLYQSRKRLHQIMQKVPARDLHRVIGRLKYFGTSFSNRQMALFFQSADAYVSPYRAEGFNMPVLEAAACGLPIICTGGGSTDDFVTEAFAQKIMSRKWSRRMEEQDLVQLEPDVDHLIGLMTRAIEDKAWRQQAAKAGPSHVRANYTWDQIVDRLVQGLWH